MQIILTRHVTATCYRALANVDIKQTRPDIQKALELVETDYDSLPDRLINYLEKESLLREQQLTELGRKTCKSGLLASRESGIYDLWYLDQDDFLKSKPLLLQRVAEPVKNGYQQRKSFYSWPEAKKIAVTDARHSANAKILLAEDDGTCKQKSIKNLKLKVVNNGITRQKARLKLTLSLIFNSNGDCVTNFKLGGVLPVKFGNQEKAIEVNEDYPIAFNEEVLHNIAEFMNKQWNVEQHRMYSDLPKDKKALFSFIATESKLANIDTCYGKFTTGNIKYMPLMPKDTHIAKQWQENWLNELYRENYLSEKQAQYNQQTWLANPALKDYKLGIKTGKPLLFLLDRQQNPSSYWHATATHYLIPKETKSPLPSITFKDKDTLNVSDLLRYLALSEPVKHIIYSDRHYKSSTNIENMAYIARLSGAKFGKIYTTSPEVKVPENWQKQVMRSDKNNHDRYWIITTTQQQYIWKSSTSLGFVNFSNEQPKVVGNITFTQLEYKDLPDYLQQDLAVKPKKMEFEV
jgi:hypothetical protein